MEQVEARLHHWRDRLVAARNLANTLGLEVQQFKGGYRIVRHERYALVYLCGDLKGIGAVERRLTLLRGREKP